MNDEAIKPTSTEESHTHTPEPPNVNVGNTFATAFAREALLLGTKERLPLSLLQTKQDTFTPEMLEVARKNRWISPVQSSRGEKDPDILLEKGIFGAAVDRIFSLWDKENDPQVKFDSLRKRYAHIRATGTSKIDYVYLDEVVDNESINNIDVIALRRKFSANIWIDKNSQGRQIFKLSER
ncbi:MAG: hypothetical protein UW68_C0017G0025 [Candidatus Collierbacteria bacterium GW2011_GWB1_44_6]|uniref:Uncharacterized protein n=2 Tax=Candidatus Collieribacteriota TaxID=1752725 RepID=A0A0G1JP23_9BACT|nr:MAG: hypothetical protein UV68_C0016G0007 [Candidatus Collierbacteria bacterium GW2011_GWC2_43_12]KKT73090.1 MAG: hypothetical protein UW68_C0017G0025 [Candidatus Collierbacteria bacterium GW2011_GWB1_44_6]